MADINLNVVKGVMVSFLVIAVITFTIIITVKLTSDPLDTTVPLSNRTTFLADVNTAKTITPLGEGITDLTPVSYNQTWLELDGKDDNVTITSTNVESISFWYKNATTDWQHIVNASGTIYVNGSLKTALLYPLFDNGDDYVIGMFDDSTFVNVSVDDIRTYSIPISANQVQSLFSGGRI